MKKIFSLLTTRTKYDPYLTAIYFLNLADYLFTLVLLSGGAFTEANPLLQYGINNFSGFAAKCILPLLMVMYVHLRVCTHPPVHTKIAGILLSACISFYLFVDIMHIFWLFFYIGTFR